MNKNIIKNGVIGVISFSLGSLVTVKLLEVSVAEYLKKNCSGSMDKYKDNDIIMGYYENWKRTK